MRIAILEAPLYPQVAPAPSSQVLEKKPTLLWINLSLQLESPSPLTGQLQRFCEIRQLHQHTSGAINPQDTAHATAPDVLVFEYDYPDIDSLNILRKTRQQHPNIPIIMFTLHHSEALAIWALRNGVSDYYYKPLNPRQVNDIGLSLRQWFHSSDKPTTELGNRFLGNGYPDEVRFKQSVEHVFSTQLAINYVEQHLAEKICEDDVAKLYGLSRFQFSRHFKKSTDVTFQHYLLSCRIEKAKTLLRNPKAQVADVAFAVGFTDPAYFARMFKRQAGLMPSQWKEIISNN